MTEAVYPINIWINEERYDELRRAGLADMAEEVFAGLKRLRVPVNQRQKDTILIRFPMAKYDSATTGSIELLPKKVKEQILELVVARRSLDVIDVFLEPQ